MIDALLKKLHTQATEKVTKELAEEHDLRVKKYMATAVKVLVKTGILTDQDARTAASKYKLLPSSVLPRPEPKQYDDGCGGTTTRSASPTKKVVNKPSSGGCSSQSVGNRC